MCNFKLIESRGPTMDSNRRHHLAQNDLANWVITQYEEWIGPNIRWIGWAVLAVLALIVGVFGYSALNAKSKAAAWQQYYNALYAPEASTALENLISSSNGSIADRARLTLAQIQLAEASSAMTQDKTQSIEKLDKAIDNFKQVQQKTSDPDFKRQATLGLAQAYETAATVRTDKNDLEEAKKEYKTLSELGENDFYGRKAAKQLAFISRPDTVKFYELSSKKANEAPKAEDFKVDIDTKDPFASGTSFDPQKALGETSILGGEFAVPASKTEKQADAETKPEEKKTDDKPDVNSVEPAQTESVKVETNEEKKE